MPQYIADKYINNKVASHKEIQEWEHNQKKAKRAALTTTVSIGILSNVISSNVISKFSKDEVTIEQTTPEKRVEHVTKVKSNVYSSPETYGVKQQFTKSGKEVIATVTKEQAEKLDNSMNLPVKSGLVSNVKSVGVKDGKFEPYATYFADKGAETLAPDEGKIVKKDDTSLIIEHSNEDGKQYSIIKGVKSELKEGSNVKKDQILGKVIGGVLKFSVAKSVENGEVSEFINPEILVDEKSSEQLKTKELLNTKAEIKQEKKSDITLTNDISSSEEKTVKALPYGETIMKAAGKHDVNPLLIAGVIQQESAFDAKAISKSGAMGLMQLMPETAEWLGAEDAYDPEQNVEAGTKFLKKLIDKYKDPELAVYAYNGGPGNVDMWESEGLTPEEFPWTETREYAEKVLSKFDELKDDTAKAPVKSTPVAEQGYENKISSIKEEYKKPIKFGKITDKLRGLRIGIDAGHYPTAPGAVSYDKKTTELEVNRELKQLVISKLEEAGATVVESQGDTKSLQPGQRAEVFDANDVDFALSLHNNAATNQSASGTETLFEQGVPESQALAQHIQTNIAKAIPTTDNRGTKERNNLGVFTEGETVTALVETGFMSNPYDMELLRNDTVKENISNAIVNGFIGYAESSNLVSEVGEQEKIQTPEPKDKKEEDSEKKKDKPKDSDDKGSVKKDEPKKDSNDKESEKKEEVPKKDSDNKDSENKETDEMPKETSADENKGAEESTKEIEKVEEEKSPEKIENENSDSTSNTQKDSESETKTEENKKEESIPEEKVDTNQKTSEEEEHSFIFSKFFE